MLARGGCSFCGRDRSRTRVLLGTPGKPTEICDDCLAFCCDIVGRESGYTCGPGEPPMEQRALDELFERAQRLVASRRKIPAAPRRRIDFRCSFCDRGRFEVGHLVTGPRVFICDECVGSAADVVVDALAA